MVKKKDKAGSMSSATRTITATDIKIENGVMVDENGDVVSQISNYLPEDIESFKLTIKFEISDEEVSE